METTYRILATNALEVKAQEKGDAKNDEISVVVLENEYQQGVEKYYAFRWGQYYDPENEYKPNIKGNMRIKEDMQEKFLKLLPEAKLRYLEMKKADREKAFKNSTLASDEKFELERIIVGLRDEIQRKNDTLTEKYEHIVMLEAKIAELKNISTNDPKNDQLAALIAQTQKTLEQAQNMIPKTITINIGEKINKMNDTILHSEFETIITCLANGIHVYMYGPAGTGKSTIGEKAADALDRDFIPESALRDDIKITGYKDSNGIYHESTFYRAMKDGKLYMIDEIDNSHPDVLTVINTAIAQRYFIFPNGEKVKAHKDFMVIVAGNTTGNGGDEMYIRNQIDAANRDRFVMIEINYELEIEKAITDNNMDLIEFCHEYRKALELTDGIRALFTYRALSHITVLEKAGMELEKILKISLISDIAKDDIRLLARNINVNPSNKYLKALKKAV